MEACLVVTAYYWILSYYFCISCCLSLIFQLQLYVDVLWHEFVDRLMLWLGVGVCILGQMVMVGRPVSKVSRVVCRGFGSFFDVCS
jgi:hypothetical protein